MRVMLLFARPMCEEGVREDGERGGCFLRRRTSRIRLDVKNSGALDIKTERTARENNWVLSVVSERDGCIGIGCG